MENFLRNINVAKYHYKKYKCEKTKNVTDINNNIRRQECSVILDNLEAKMKQDWISEHGREPPTIDIVRDRRTRRKHIKITNLVIAKNNI